MQGSTAEAGLHGILKAQLFLKFLLVPGIFLGFDGDLKLLGTLEFVLWKSIAKVGKLLLIAMEGKPLLDTHIDIIKVDLTLANFHHLHIEISCRTIIHINNHLLNIPKVYPSHSNLA